MKNQTDLLLENQQLQTELAKLRHKNAFFEEEIEGLTRDIAQAEGALLEERMKAKKRAQTFKFIQLMYQEITSAKDVNDIYDITVSYLAEKVGFDRAIILEKQDNDFKPVASHGYALEYLMENLKNPFFAGLAEQNNGILVNGKTKPLYAQSYEFDFQVKHFIAVPFSGNDINHILFVGNQTEDTLRRPRLTEGDLEMLQILANQISIVIGRVQLQAQTQEAARIAQEQAQQLKVTLRELQQTQAQLIQTEKLSGLGQMVAGVAHEINNPVTFIIGNLTHISNYTQDLLSLLYLYQQYYPNPVSEIQKEAEIIDLEFLVKDMPNVLSSMEIGAERIRQIVVSLRNFSRTDQVEMKPADIHEGIDNTLLILQHRLKPHGNYTGIEIVKEYGELPLVKCFAGQLNQVFMNILSNAIDAMENQEKPRKITISTQIVDSCELRHNQDFNHSMNHSVVIRIRDNGFGITESVKRHLFNPFFTTKPVGKGTGLGLSISYEIVVEKHGGVLECFSEPGQGAEFWIEIPLKSATADYVDEQLSSQRCDCLVESVV